MRRGFVGPHQRSDPATVWKCDRAGGAFRVSERDGSAARPNGAGDRNRAAPTGRGKSSGGAGTGTARAANQHQGSGYTFPANISTRSRSGDSS